MSDGVCCITNRKDNTCSRISSLKNHVKDKYSYEGIEFPATYEASFKLEELNKICAYAYTISPEEEIVLEKPGTTPCIQNDLSYLLRIDDDEENSTYVYIKKTEHLINSVSSSANKDKRFLPYLQWKDSDQGI